MLWQQWQIENTTLADSTTTQQIEAPEQNNETTAKNSDIPEAAKSTTSLAAPSADNKKSAGVITATTDVLALTIDTKGGDVVESKLLVYPETTNIDSKPVQLFQNEEHLYIAQSGLLHDKVGKQNKSSEAPNHNNVYSYAKKNYALHIDENEIRIPLLWKSPTGVVVKKTYILKRGSFLVEVIYEVKNNSQNKWVGRQYRQLKRGGVRDEETSYFLITYTGAAYFDDTYRKLAFEDMEKSSLSKNIKGGWAAVLQHHFVSAWVPDNNEETNLYYTKAVGDDLGSKKYIIGLRSPAQEILPGETKNFRSFLYTGPKEQEKLVQISPGLELTVDYGIFTFIAQPLFWLLSNIYSVINNWGWSIIFVTILIKLLFYKLSETSYRSMAKMRKFTPRMQALRERYGDDRQKLNQAMMEMYKKEKINPLGGCWPILVQIPVFISLYWVLLESVELRQAPFMLWLNDLSSKDPYFVLPLLMGITMFIQQKLNPTPPDPIQAKIMSVLPIVFTIFFAFFPSGLVLYWFVNNLLSIAQQWVIIKRLDA